MAAEITFTPTEQDYLDANRDWFLTGLRRWRAWSRILVFVAFCAASGGLAAYLSGDSAEIPAFMIGFALLGLAIHFPILGVFYLTLGRRTRRLYRQQKSLQHPWTYRWTSSALSLETVNGVTSHPWADFHRWLLGRRALLLFLNDQLFLFVPRRLLDDSTVGELSARMAAAGVPRL